MAGIKLARLPDRSLVKCTIQLSPSLEAALQRYAVAYEAEYGQAEGVVDLIPHMLAVFLGRTIDCYQRNRPTGFPTEYDLSRGGVPRPRLKFTPKSAGRSASEKFR